MLPINLFAIELVKKELLIETSKTILNLISGINEFNLDYVNMILENLDIIKTIELVDSLYKNINNKYLLAHKIIAYNNLHDISIKIKKELELINKGIKESENYWFKFLRTPPYHENI